MAAFSAPSLSSNADYKKLVNYTRLLNDQLLYMFNNIDPEDNFGLDALVQYNQVGNTLQQLELTTNGLISKMIDLETNVGTEIRILNGKISLKVSSGELASEISATTDTINFKTGSLIIDSKNFSLDSAGNAEFSGSITGGSININERFTVQENGTMTSELLTVAKEVHCEGLLRSNYMNIAGNADIEGSMTCTEMRVYGPLYCHEYYFPSDRRLKENIKDIDDQLAYDIVMRLRPVSFDFISNKEKSIGLIAQEVEEIEKEMNLDFPLVLRGEEFLGVAYANNSVLLAGAIKIQRKQIEELEKKVEELR